MWNHKKYILSSFVGINQGKILDCCGKLSVNKKKYVHPFCTQNIGVIENAATDAEHEESTSQKKDSISEEQPENNIEIRSALQLMEIVRQVNFGDSFYYGGNYKLMEDLDMKDQKWVPFGGSELTPFCGKFDGNGHCIKNLSIRGKRTEYTGFFGYLKKAVIKDLSVEGKVKGGKYTGALAGISEDSVISSCFASAKVYGSYCAGGFIGKNTGTITHCYFSGSVQHRTIPPIIIALKPPGNGNTYVGVRLPITDQELLDTNGSNGTIEEEQKKLDETSLPKEKD